GRRRRAALPRPVRRLPDARGGAGPAGGPGAREGERLQPRALGAVHRPVRPERRALGRGRPGDEPVRGDLIGRLPPVFLLLAAFSLRVFRVGQAGWPNPVYAATVRS